MWRRVVAKLTGGTSGVAFGDPCDGPEHAASDKASESDAAAENLRIGAHDTLRRR
jgi:hypothetical protein